MSTIKSLSRLGAVLASLAVVAVSFASKAADRGIASMSLRARFVAAAALATTSFRLAPSALAASHPVMLKLVNRVSKLR